MVVALAFCSKDAPLAHRVIEWIGTLDERLPNHTLVLLGSHTSDLEHQGAMFDHAKKIFGKVDSIRQKTADDRPWPIAPNVMFTIASKFVAQAYHAPFFWLEPDAIPLKPGWLDALEREYLDSHAKFMGTVVSKPEIHMNGVGIYPANFIYNGAEELAFDMWLAPKILSSTRHTNLIHHEWGNAVTNTPWTFPDRDSLDRIQKAAVVFHRCKTGDLLDRLVEARALTGAISRSSQQYTLPEKVRRSVKGLLRLCSSYYHSGNLGELIYALYAIKLDGGGDLIIGPEQRKTHRDVVPIILDQFNLLKPLLEIQPYVKTVEFSEHYPATRSRFVDLNAFRNGWNDPGTRNRLHIHTLAKMHCHLLGVLPSFREDETWLECGEPIKTDRIIINRTLNHTASDFPWQKLVNNYGKDLLFVGLEHEHNQFCFDFGKVSYWKPRDFLEFAKIIQGGRAFAGNQSFALSLALGLGKRVLCESWEESPDCRFLRPTYRDQVFGGFEEMDKWLTPP